MTQTLIALSIWLHALATVVFIGYYVLLALIYLPALQGKDLGSLSEISRRSRTWLYIAMLVFAVTGTYLTLVDTNYLGLAKFGNLWTVLMLVKHLLLLAMVGMGFWFNALQRVGPLMSSNTGAAQAAARFRSYVTWMAVCGVVVLLLTAIAQVR